MEFPQKTTQKQVTGGESSSRLPQYLAAVAVNLGAFTYGTVVGWSANAVPYLQSQDSPLQDGPISNEEASWLTSLLCLVAVPATPLYSYLCQRYGCKTSGYLVAIPYIANWILTIFANSITLLYISKFIVGISAGGCYIVSNIYVRDIAEDSIRGSLTSLMVMFVNAGLVFAYTIGTLFSYQVVSFISLTVPCLFLAAFYFMPETPIYLLRRERHVEASKSLQWLRGKDADVSQELEHIKGIIKSMNAEDSSSPSIRELFTPKSNLRAFLIGVVLCFNQQLCGFFGIINYTVIIFKESGSDLSPNVSSIIVGVMLFSGTYLSSLLVERAGRKILLLISNIVMAVSLGVLGLYFYFKQEGNNLSIVGWIPVTCMSFFVVVFAIGLFPIPYVMLTEIFSPRIREMASSIAIAETWVLAFVVAKSFTFLGEALGLYGCYWLFAAVCIMGTLFVIFEVPETRGRSLECIQEELSGNHGRVHTKVYTYSSTEEVV